ncbi:hypothetical protein LCGC14_2955220, partial [marine sediment metagenome]
MFLALGLLVVGLVGAMLLAVGAASRPSATAPVSSAPATAPVSRPANSYPPAKLARACRTASTKMLARLDRTFRAVVRPPFVVIGNLPAARLEQIAAGSVVRPAQAMWRSYFRRRPTDVITVLLFRDGKSYRRWAKKLFADTDVPHFGYYRQSNRTMVMDIATGTGTLVHELTHALIAYDFPAVPDWFNEGLGSLHEQCYVRPDGIVGAVNWRLPALQKAIRDGQLRPLADLLTRKDFYGTQRGMNYAQGRYFVMYMQKRKLLRKFYRSFHARAGRDAVKAVEEVFDRDLKQIEPDF